jgi:hypothetical protein
MANSDEQRAAAEATRAALSVAKDAKERAAVLAAEGARRQAARAAEQQAAERSRCSGH